MVTAAGLTKCRKHLRSLEIAALHQLLGSTGKLSLYFTVPHGWLLGEGGLLRHATYEIVSLDFWDFDILFALRLQLHREGRVGLVLGRRQRDAGAAVYIDH
jgi:hypothetical protein